MGEHNCEYELQILAQVDIRTAPEHGSQCALFEHELAFSCCRYPGYKRASFNRTRHAGASSNHCVVADYQWGSWLAIDDACAGADEYTATYLDITGDMSTGG